MRQNGIIHFDAHYFNVLTNGEQIYLTDFGLALDKQFTLTPEEETFFQQNVYYDYGEILWGLGFLLLSMYRALPAADKQAMMGKYSIKEDARFYELVPILLHNLEQIYADGIMALDKAYVAGVAKYSPIILLMSSFYADIVKNSKKDTKFPQTKLRRLLKETEFLPI